MTVAEGQLLLGEPELRERIERLAAIPERGSAMPGERDAAGIIAAELRDLGARVRIDEERAHGGYWWPIGLPTAAAALAGLSRSRVAAFMTGCFAAAAVADDVTGGSLWFRRRFLPQRITWNVVAEFGDPDAERIALVVAHHDAAHSGIVFHPALPREFGRRFPKALERTNTTPGTLWGAFAGPLAVAVGALVGSRGLRRAGATVSAGYAAAMADIGARGVVPGANDNLTGVAALLSLGHSLAEQPLDGLRVILLSNGSEESFMEGMQGFARRHFASLPRERTSVVCIDTVGSPRLAVLRGEGMLGVREYDAALLKLADQCAEELGMATVPNLRFRNATDALIALKAGYPTITLGSVDQFKAPANYHWPTDVPENVDYGTLADCARLTRRLLERLSETDRRRVAA